MLHSANGRSNTVGGTGLVGASVGASVGCDVDGTMVGNRVGANVGIELKKKEGWLLG